MRLTPRKDEVKAVVELLESDGYDSAEALAKDVIKRVADAISQREWHAYAWRTGPGAPVLTWGPLTSEAEVRKFAEKAGLGGEHLSVKLYSTDSMLERIEGQGEGKSKFCGACEHPLGAHEHPQMSGRCAVGRCHCKQAT